MIRVVERLVKQFVLEFETMSEKFHRSVEIRHLPPGPGNGRTYTSGRPDSLEAYASHRPSGENIGSHFDEGAVQKDRWRAGLPARRFVSLHRQDHQVVARLRD